MSSIAPAGYMGDYDPQLVFIHGSIPDIIMDRVLFEIPVGTFEYVRRIDVFWLTTPPPSLQGYLTNLQVGNIAAAYIGTAMGFQVDIWQLI
ncbi:hypothetical protein TcasGA2_TC005149 [Tribolium castaneum]|uniref:Uncharacterized protein n=1 Tax=Tribolium castaneum TaxID=7070 RepID=D7ELS7_TRICA|nr:hypothetical protein TcasGA2_TC005149 [Tribolium castaneum]